MASNSGVTLAKAWVTIIPTTEGAEKAITDALTPGADKAGEKVGKAMGGKIAAGLGAAAKGGMLAAGAAVVAFGKSSIETGQQFEAAMSNVAALSGATGEDLAALEATAREFGSTTKFSAAAAADALGYMALAGWDTTQMTEGLGGVLDLAAASGMGLAESADMVTDYLSAFGMAASDSAYFADMLAYAQANSNTSAAQLGEAYRNCAANLNAAGQDVETVTSLLGSMANQGLKGSEAGTALSAIMRDITARMQDGAIQIGNTSVAVTDADGNFRDLTDILADVEAATQGMGDAERAAALSATFTADSTKGLNLIMNEGVSKAAEFEEGLRSSEGAAASMAATMNDNLQGDLANLNSAFEETQIKLYQAVSPALRDGAQAITGALIPALGDGITELGNFLNGTEETVPVYDEFGTQIGTTTAQSDGFLSKLGEIGEKFAPLGESVGNLASSLGDTLGPVFEAVGGVAGTFASTLGDLAEPASGLVDAFAGFIDTTGPAVQGAFDMIGQSADLVFGGLGVLVETGINDASGALDTFSAAASGDWSTAWSTFESTVSGHFGGLASAAETTFPGLTSTINGAWDTISTQAGTTWATIQTGLSTTWSGITTTAGTTWESTKGKIGQAMDGAATKLGQVSSTIQTGLETAWSGISSTADTTWQGIQRFMEDPIGNAQTTLGTITAGITSTFDSWGIDTLVSDIFSPIEGFMTDPITNAQGLIDSAASTISGIITGMDLSLPSIALPHFWVSGGEFPWGIGGMGSPPDFGVKWYAKGGFVDTATLVGVGEAGPEMILPRTGSLMDQFGATVASYVAGAGATINVYISGDVDSRETADYLARQTGIEVERALAYGI